jgi:hypothetical protein
MLPSIFVPGVVRSLNAKLRPSYRLGFSLLSVSLFLHYLVRPPCGRGGVQLIWWENNINM